MSDSLMYHQQTVSLLCWPVLVPQITGGLVVPGLDTVNVSAIKVEIVLPISVLKVENE